MELMQYVRYFADPAAPMPVVAPGDYPNPLAGPTLRAVAKPLFPTAHELAEWQLGDTTGSRTRRTGWASSQRTQRWRKPDPPLT
jgi:hypothetical protein